MKPPTEKDIRQGVEQAREAYRRSLEAVEVMEQLAVSAGVSLEPTPPRVLRANRLEIVEPDGTIRMILSAAATFPGIILRGEETPHPDRSGYSGLLFFNDDGTETGGLIYDGRHEGPTSSGTVHLSFDGVERDQMLALTVHDRGPGDQSAKLVFADQPGGTLADLMAHLEGIADVHARKAATEAYVGEHGWMIPRMRLATETDESVGLTFSDASGHPRLVIGLDASGEPAIRFLDAHGDPATRGFE